MSEIEFRAWDTTLLRMFIPLSLEDIFYGDFSNTKFDQLIFMQYTGIKDINGDKIFAGDIVRCWSGNPQNELDYRELIGKVEYIVPYFRVDGNELVWNAENIEIIGNIYENKDRLC